MLIIVYCNEKVFITSQISLLIILLININYYTISVSPKYKRQE